jgi:hypothetical protein
MDGESGAGSLIGVMDAQDAGEVKFTAIFRSAVGYTVAWVPTSPRATNCAAGVAFPHPGLPDHAWCRARVYAGHPHDLRLPDGPRRVHVAPASSLTIPSWGCTLRITS